MKEEVFKYFTENNKSGWKMKEKNLKNDDMVLYENLINYNKLIKGDVTFTELIYMYVYEILEKPKCECGNNVLFLDIKRGFQKFCSRSCSNKSIKTKEVLPKDLKNIEPFQKSIEFYCDIFLPRLVKNMGFDYDETIKEAKMSIKFDFQDKVYRSDGVFCIGFIANTILIDEFEKIYSKDYESKVILSLETIDEVKERYFTKNKESENRFVDYN